MDVLASAYDSDEPTDERDEEESQENTKINFEESSSVFQAISQRCTPDSAPRVADKVINVWYSIISGRQCSAHNHIVTHTSVSCTVELQSVRQT